MLPTAHKTRRTDRGKDVFIVLLQLRAPGTVHPSTIE